MKGTYLTDFISLIFPELCQACGNSLVYGEDLLCTACILDLPYTNFHQHPDNVVSRQLWGRIDTQIIHVLLYFSKGGKVQQLMHRFKYQNSPLIGNKLGMAMGAQLLQTFKTHDIGLVIPVPLHQEKLKLRGYNQSAHFGSGIAQKMGIYQQVNNLVRVRFTETQTKKSRFVRYENMKDVFVVKNPESLEDKHVLLVDDIITTGATLEACANQLLKIPGLKLSIAAIAYAE